MHFRDALKFYTINNLFVVCAIFIFFITILHMSDLESGQASAKPVRVWYLDLIDTN